MSKSSHSTASIVAASITASGAVAAVSLWNIFRRRAPLFTNKDLLPDPVGDLHVVRKLEPAEREGLKETISSSFDYLYSAKEDKSVSSQDTEETEDTADSEVSLEDMEAAVDSFVEYVLHIAENYGHIIKSVDNDGNYQGSVCVIPPISRQLYKAYSFSGLMHLKMLSTTSWRDLFSSRRYNHIDAFDDRLNRTSRLSLEDRLNDQWFVLNLGVAPSASGKRLGTRMMHQVFHWAKDSPVIWNPLLPPLPALYRA